MGTGSVTDAEEFYLFLGSQLKTGATDRSPEELLNDWRADRREYDETVREIEQCVDDMEAGAGTALDQVASEIRKEFGLKRPDE